jgi:hypothetical protein
MNSSVPPQLFFRVWNAPRWATFGVAGSSWVLWGGLIAVVALVQTVCFYRHGELPVYLQGAERLVAGEAIYRHTDQPAFSYPPFFALLFVPLVWLPAAWAEWSWNALNLSLAAICLRLLWQAMQPWLVEGGPTKSSLWVYLAALLMARFVLSPLEYRSHDYLLLALMLAGLRASQQQREAWAGIWLGLATACKATPLLFLPMLLLQRRWRAAGAMSLALSCATLLPDVITPAQSGTVWVMSWYNVFVSKVDASGPAAVQGAWRAWNPLNQSLSGTVYRLTTPPGEAEFLPLAVQLTEAPAEVRKGVTLALLGLVFCATLAVTCRRPAEAKRSRHDLACWCTILCAMLLLSPMTSKQHFCSLAAPLLLGSARLFAAAERRSWSASAGLGVGLATVLLCGVGLAKDLVGKAPGDYALAWGSLTVCTVALWWLSVGAVRACQGATKGSRARVAVTVAAVPVPRAA